MSIEDMPNEDMRDVAELCGIEVAVSLIKHFQGSKISVPRNRAYLKLAEKFIIANYDGDNAKRLSQVCCCSLDYVYKCIKKEDSRRLKSRGVKHEQLSVLHQLMG
jgi:Mor family transcriptional regulator